jgi:Insertion element 4 transposase N-terminal
MIYYVIALALYTTASTREVLRCLLEGLRWLWGAEAVKVAGKSGISYGFSMICSLKRLRATNGSRWKP